MSLIFKTTPEKAKALVAKFEAQKLEAESDVKVLKAQHQDAVFADMEEGSARSGIDRTKAQKALEAAEIKLTELCSAFEGAKARHTASLKQAEKDQCDSDWAEVHRLGDVALKKAAVVEKLAVDMAREFSSLVDICRRQYAVAPQKDSLLGDSPIGELALQRHLRQVLFKSGAKWAYRYLWNPNDIRPFAESISNGNRWVTQFEHQAPTGNLGRIKGKIHLPTATESEAKQNE